MVYTKNVRKEEWAFIISRIDERKRPTNVRVRGNAISQKKIDKARSRGYNHVKTYEKLASQFRPTPQPRPQTPEGIEVFTPPPISDDPNLHLSEDSEHVENMCEDGPAASGPRSGSPQVSDSGFVSSQVYTAIDAAATPKDSWQTPIVTREAFITPSPSSSSTSDAELPPSLWPLYDYIYAAIIHSNDDFTNDICIPEKQPLPYRSQSLLRLFVQRTIPKDDLYGVVSRTESVYDLALLQDLLLISNATAKWKHFSERLLFDAAKHRNQALLKVLLNPKVDINAQCAHRRAYNALQAAVHSRHEDKINLLISCGAPILTGNSGNDLEFLHEAASNGTMDLVQPMLAKIATSGGLPVQKVLKLFISAVKSADHVGIDALLEAGFSPYDSPDEKFYPQFMEACWSLTEDYDTPFMAALDMCIRRGQKLFGRYGKDLWMDSPETPDLGVGETMIAKFLNLPIDHLEKKQQVWQRNQIALAHHSSTFVRQPRLQQLLKIGLDARDTVFTTLDREC